MSDTNNFSTRLLRVLHLVLDEYYPVAAKLAITGFLFLIVNSNDNPPDNLWEVVAWTGFIAILFPVSFSQGKVLPNPGTFELDKVFVKSIEIIAMTTAYLGFAVINPWLEGQAFVALAAYIFMTGVKQHYNPRKSKRLQILRTVAVACFLAKASEAFLDAIWAPWWAWVALGGLLLAFYIGLAADRDKESKENDKAKKSSPPKPG